MIFDHITGMVVKMEHSQFGINLSYNLHLILSTSYIHNTTSIIRNARDQAKSPVNQISGYRVSTLNLTCYLHV